MNKQIFDRSAIAPNCEPLSTLMLLPKNSLSQVKLVAVWQLDEHSQLYCQWVQATDK